ncbi:MAG: small ribosomal subunit biogenesis GTPase RsgA [Pseudomonadales bacterium]|nr:small ribosomal subunit biogenesis GTPase RsgA [Pseudomonadales bacterium]
MSKRKLTRRQAWRIEKVQQEKARRAEHKNAQVDSLFSDDALGAEQSGLVIAHYGTLVEIEATEAGLELSGQPVDMDIDPEKRSYRCHFRPNLGHIVVGDQVVWRADKQNSGVIEALKPRLTELSRPDSRGQLKPVAANIDRIFIVISSLPEPLEILIDRYLVEAERLEIEPVLVLNKSDLIDAGNRQALERLLSIYRNIGYTVLEVSTYSDHGMDRLAKALDEHTSIFVGQSGVGKSSLIQVLLPNEQLKTGAVSSANLRGRHTTSTARLYHFHSGGSLIDSPGIREFGLSHLTRREVTDGFVEFRPYVGLCHFRDCKHLKEPRCALLEAEAEGHLHPSRLHSYRRILHEIDD